MVAIRTYVREAHKAGCRLTRGGLGRLRAAESGCFARRLHVNHRAADRPLPSGTGQRHPSLPAVRRRRGQRTGGITAATTGAKPRRADAGTVGVGWSSHPRASKASKGWVSRGLQPPRGRHECPSGPPARGGRIGIRCAGRGGPAVASGSSTGRPAGWPRCVHRWWPQVPALLSPGGIRSRFSVPPAAHHCCTLSEVPQPTGKAVSRPASAPTSFRPVNSRSTSAAIHPTACGRTRHRRPGTDLADHAPIPRPPAGDWGRTRRR